MSSEEIAQGSSRAKNSPDENPSVLELGAAGGAAGGGGRDRGLPAPPAGLQGLHRHRTGQNVRSYHQWSKKSYGQAIYTCKNSIIHALTNLILAASFSSIIWRGNKTPRKRGRHVSFIS